MNRRKKIKDILTKRNKQATLKANPKKAKPKYISKAERAKMEADAATESTIDTVTTENTEESSAEENNA
ncbi:hypothetical protein MUS1_05890 [Marinomonas ushuaiensis DSM 15871]|uniref:DUF2986 domain-containing protein n=1 Tax=Marinomonas ushuaiensis DSM 15871 TaxID=1122207 RepID=X7E176_9GAMM|nr:DUF2986 domain-containing protein [Marinomonas ushuaiensis]ETX09727.1 hypothetical protein MUS1_05890 [Marinomonas ushuaiensis DSM 15871]